MEEEVMETPVEFQGRTYITPKEFAARAKRSVHSVYAAIRDGNGQRKMECVVLAGRKMVPVEELERYPFTKAQSVEIELGEQNEALRIDNERLRLENNALREEIEVLRAVTARG